MPLLLNQWQEPDPTGVVNAWLSGLASAQHDQALQQAQAAAVAHSLQEQARLQQQREHEDRLLRAEEFRQQLLLDGQTPWQDVYAQDGGGAKSPAAAAGASATPAATAATATTPQDGASIVLGMPTTGGALIGAANAGDNAALSTMDALGGGSAPGLTLAQPNPNAAPVSLGAPLQFPSPAAAVVPASAAAAVSGSDVVPAAPVTPAAEPVTPADMVLAGGSDFSKPVDLLTAANPVGGMAAASATTPGTSNLPIDWMKSIEGFAPRAFKDGKQLSIGYGTKAQSPNETITPAEATERLTQELSDSAKSVDNAAEKAGMKLTPAQRDALISYDYNTGKGAAAITQSGGDPRAVASAILHGPVTQDGRIMPGLVTRRRAEYARFMSDAAPMPDDATVAPPAPGTGAAAALPVASDPASQVLASGQAEIRRLSADMARNGVPKKVAQAAIIREQQKVTAAVLAAAKPAPARNIDPRSQAGIDADVAKAKAIADAHNARVADLTKDMTFVPEHNTYKKADGSEWFVNGKSLTSYRPLQVKAERWAQGDDGQVYPLGNNGEPLKPVPDGVKLNLTGGKIQTRTVNGTLYQVNPDGTQKPIITSQAMPKANDRVDFESDLKQLHVLADDYNTKKRAVEQNGSHTFYGTSSADVDAAKKKLDEVKDKMDRWQRTYPGVKAALQASAPEPPPPPADSAPTPAASAPVAAAGADMVRVISPAGQPGVIPRSSLPAAMARGFKTQ